VESLGVANPARIELLTISIQLMNKQKKKKK